MVVSDDVERKIDKDNRLLEYFNESKPTDFMPREVVIAFQPVSDPRDAAALAGRINAVLNPDADFRMQAKKGAAVFSNVRAEKMAEIIGMDFVVAAGVGKLYRQKPNTEVDGRY